MVEILVTHTHNKAFKSDSQRLVISVYTWFQCLIKAQWLG